jgi:hypothetical protein
MATCFVPDETPFIKYFGGSFCRTCQFHRWACPGICQLPGVIMISRLFSSIAVLSLGQRATRRATLPDDKRRAQPRPLARTMRRESKSAIGTKRTCQCSCRMSAIEGSANLTQCAGDDPQASRKRTARGWPRHGDWHYLAGLAFRVVATIAAESTLAGRGRRSGRTGIVAD